MIYRNVKTKEYKFINESIERSIIRRRNISKNQKKDPLRKVPNQNDHNLMMLLTIPSETQIKKITKDFLDDLQSFTITDKLTNEIRPVICCVCDSIPTESQWSTYVDVKEFKRLCERAKLCKTDCYAKYPRMLRMQYTAKDERLKDFILSPETYVNGEDDVLICKNCLSCLQKNSKISNEERRRPPSESIIRGYMIGDAPDILTSLNSVELSLITKVNTQCQSWIFFAGCHQHIKGWHTFFRGRPGDNVANMTLLTESGWKGHILVVMCGPFTNQQSKMTRAKTSVCPNKVIRSWRWLKANNYRYSETDIPNIADIPLPYIMDEER